MSTAPAPFATPHDALLEAIRRIGSQQKAARAADVSAPSVWRWVRDARPCPQKYVLGLATAAGMSPRDLRPDLYWPDDVVAAALAGPAAAAAVLTAQVARGEAVGPALPIANDNCCCTCACCRRQHPPAG